MISLEKFILKNGLRAYYLFNPKSLISFLQVWYNIGSAQEEEEKSGILHLLEHLFFKGTKEVPPEEFTKIIQKNGGICNAFTSEERVCFYESIPQEKLELIIKLEADRMENLNLNEEVFLKEKSVVLEEYKEMVENKPLMKPFIRLRKEIFGDHPFSRDPIGNEFTIKNITLEDVKNYYNDFFHPKNCIIILVSSIHKENVYEILERHFGKISKEVKKPKEIPPFHRPKKDYFEEKIPIKANFYSKIYFLKKEEKYDFPLLILHNLLGAEEDSLLSSKIDRKKFYVLKTGTFPFFSKNLYLFLFYSMHLPILKKYNFLKIIENLMEKELYEKLNEEKLMELKGRLFIQRIASLHGTEKQGLYLSDCIITRENPDAFFEDSDKIKKIKRDDIFECLEKMKSSPSCEIFLKGSLWKKI